MLAGNLNNFRADPAVLLFLVWSVTIAHTGELIIGRTSGGSMSLVSIMCPTCQEACAEDATPKEARLAVLGVWCLYHVPKITPEALMRASLTDMSGFKDI